MQSTRRRGAQGGKSAPLDLDDPRGHIARLRQGREIAQESLIEAKGGHFRKIAFKIHINIRHGG